MYQTNGSGPQINPGPGLAPQPQSTYGMNPGGHAHCGALIYSPDYPEGCLRFSNCVGYGNLMSNNVAEYMGLIKSLERLLADGKQDFPIAVFGDSKMVIEQMSGKWKIKDGTYVPYARRCGELVWKFKQIKFQWIPRESNKQADDLSKCSHQNTRTLPRDWKKKMVRYGESRLNVINK